MADYTKKTQTDNKHLSNLTSARFYHIDGGQASKVVRAGKGRLLSVTMNTKGLAFVVRDGIVANNGAVVANFATTSPEGTYDYGIYCPNGITVDNVSGSGSATLVFDE